jgi:putative transposase
MSTPTPYPTDLSDNQWERINPLLPSPKSGAGLRGRPASDLRRVIDGIVYVTKTGCQWRMLPKDFGCWSTVYGYFYRFNRGGVWKRADGTAQRRGKETSGSTRRALGGVCG